MRLGIVGLVVLHARAGSEPDWRPDWRRPKGWLSAEERIEAVVVHHARAVWCAWRDALCELQQRLAGAALEAFEPTGPACHAAPWRISRGAIRHGAQGG